MKPVTSLAVHCNYFPDSRSGTEGSATYKVKGNIHWVSCAHAVEAEVRIYDRLFMDESPDANNRGFPTVTESGFEGNRQGLSGAGIGGSTAGRHLPVERHGYFVADLKVPYRKTGIQPFRYPAGFMG